MSWCALSIVSISIFTCCLLTWLAYLVTLSIDIMWNRVSCWFCWVVIKWLILILMALTSLVVAVPVSQLSVSPKKGIRLLLMHLLETRMSWMKVPSWEVEWPPEGVADKRCTYCWDCWVLPQVLTIVGLELRASVEETIIVDVFLSSVW